MSGREGALVSRAVSIRDARPEDLDRVVELERVSFSTPWSLDSFRSLVGRDGVCFLVAEAAGTPGSTTRAGTGGAQAPPAEKERTEPGSTAKNVVAYGILWLALREAELADLAVAPESRERGIGGALLDALLDRARQAGVRIVFLEVRESNSAALALYEGRGFRQVGVRAQYYSRPREDARVLQLELDGDSVRSDGAPPQTRGDQ